MKFNGGIMKKWIVLSLLIFTASSLAFGQSEINKEIFDEVVQDTILYGYCSVEAFEKSNYKHWFYAEYQAYNADSEILKQLQLLDLEEIELILVLGTWCSDTRREVPRIVKVLRKIDFNMQHLRILCVNSYKEAENTMLFELNIRFVPTLIVKKQGIEVGRIVESPTISLEADFLTIIK